MTRAQIAYTPADGSVQLAEVTLPELRPHDVEVAVTATGVCHSQISDLKMSVDMKTPLALGHEATGTVTAVGSEVTAVAAGDPVFVTWLPRDGAPLPRRPAPASLTLDDGTAIASLNIYTWASHLTCDEQFVVPRPTDIDPYVTSIVGCAVMTGAGAVCNTADVQAGESVAVFGIGGVGISAVVAAKVAGADPIIAVDLDDGKLAWAREQGATHTINASEEDAVAKIHELTTDDSQRNIMGLPVSGVHYAFDCIGGDKVAPQLLPACRSQGMGSQERGMAVLVGILTMPSMEVNVGDVLMNEKRLAGCIGGSSRPGVDFPMFADWYRQGDLDLDSIVTERHALDDIAAVVESLDQGQITGRAIVTFD